MNGVPPVPPVPQGAAPPLAQVGGHCKTLANRVAWDLAARAGKCQHRRRLAELCGRPPHRAEASCHCRRRRRTASSPQLPSVLQPACPASQMMSWLPTSTMRLGGSQARGTPVGTWVVVCGGVCGGGAAIRRTPNASSSAALLCSGCAAGPGLAAQLQSAIHEAVQQAAVPAVQQAVQQSVQGLQQEVQALTDMAVATHNLAARLNNRNRSAKNDQLQLLRKERHPQPLAPGAAAAFGALPPPGMFPPTTAALYGEVGGGLGRWCMRSAGLWARPHAQCFVVARLNPCRPPPLCLQPG